MTRRPTLHNAIGMFKTEIHSIILFKLDGSWSKQFIFKSFFWLQAQWIMIYFMYLWNTHGLRLTCLIRHALGEKFCVEIDRMSDYTVYINNMYKKCQKGENQRRKTQGNGFHRCRIRQGLLYEYIDVFKLNLWNYIHWTSNSTFNGYIFPYIL